MSTLGAQARAAEYAAFTAARARQVSRDTEDQKLRPKPAAVSLSAFTKTQTASRNKGPKAWKPLNLDDIAESSGDGSGKESSRGTPTPSAGKNVHDRIPPPNRRDTTPLGRNETIKLETPIAPRAMMTSNTPVTLVTNPSPRRRQLQPTVKLPKQQDILQQLRSPNPFHHGGVPYPALPQYIYSRQAQYIGPPPDIEAAYSHRFGSMMVPDDISPAKQEEKLAMLSQLPCPSLSHLSHEVLAHLVPRQLVLHHSSLQYEDSHAANAPMACGAYGLEIANPVGNYSEYAIREQPYQGLTAYDGDRDEEEDGYFNNQPPSTHDFLPFSYSNTAIDYAPPVQQLSSQNAHVPSNSGNDPFRRQSGFSGTILTEYDEPYDRKSTMESFKAAATQEALARKGKTVLHNPDLHREINQPQQDDKHGYDATTPHPSCICINAFSIKQGKIQEQSYPLVPWNFPTGLSENNLATMSSAADDNDGCETHIPSKLSIEELEIVANALKNPAPSLKFPELVSRRIIPNDPISGALPDNTLEPIDQVGSKEWAQLRPFSSIERDRVRKCMAKAAADMTTHVAHPDVLGKGDGFTVRDGGLEHTQKWFRHDGRGENSLREELPAIAKKNATMRRAAAARANGGTLPEDFKLGVDDGIAASVILGEVIANLHGYFMGEKTSVEQRRNFHKVKCVPEFATERGVVGVLGLAESSDSYFDDEQSGFQRAPVRIARDPRFRPQGKEGLKLKPEEEWKNRHEMYGRRVI